MGQNMAKRLVFALGLGVALALVFDHSALGFALGFAVIFGGGIAAE